MTAGDKLAFLCIGIYLAITICYLFSRQWWKAVYYLAAAILNIAVFAMK